MISFYIILDKERIVLRKFSAELRRIHLNMNFQETVWQIKNLMICLHFHTRLEKKELQPKNGINGMECVLVKQLKIRKNISSERT